MKRFFQVLVLLMLLAGGWLIYKLNDRPALDPYAELLLPPAEQNGAGLRVTWLGVSTLLIDDGETAIMTDGFFSRPGLLKTAATKLSPDRALVSQVLAKAGVSDLSAVFVVHSHYDHVMDAPEVARQTGAWLVGSESTVMVGRGDGLPEAQMIAIKGGEKFHLGDFNITAIASKHFPHGKAMGNIKEPLLLPARATDYLEGGSYAFHIEHRGKTLLIQGSAGHIENTLDDYPADVVYLGIGLLGSRDAAYRSAYWHETVEVTGATRVIPFHWDDFFLPLSEPLLPFPSLLDDFDTSMRFIQTAAQEQGVDVRLVPAWQPTNPFVGLD